MSEHSPKMESCEETSEYFWENSKKPRQQSCDPSFLKYIELFLNYAFMSLLGIDYMSKFTSDNSLHLAIVICLWKIMLLPHFACPCDCTPYSGDYSNAQGINSLMLRIELAIDETLVCFIYQLYSPRFHCF